MADFWWKDIDIELNKKFDGDINDFTEEMAVWQAIRNILLTTRGERVHKYEFARGIYYALFEPIDKITARKIGDLLYGAIRTWEPRAIIEDFLVSPKPEQNRYDVRLTFRIKGNQSPEDPFVMEQTIYAA